MNELSKKGFLSYQDDAPLSPRVLIPEVFADNQDKWLDSIAAVFDMIPIRSGMTLSFHHHLRNGDFVLNLVIEEIKRRKLTNMTLAPSAIFPIHEPMVELIKSGQIKHVYTNYINGPVADIISYGYLQGDLIMDTHGGRPRAIESGELPIDVAFIATPACDSKGNGNGVDGPSACGSLGYAMADLMYAKNKVLVTDFVSENLTQIDLPKAYVHFLVKVDSIGDPKGIVSGTTQPTRDPIQLKIARNTAQLIDELGFIKDQMSFQTGAGGTSLAVASDVKTRMLKKQIKGSFASGGITSFLVDMQKRGLFENLYDVQCFDHEAVDSFKNNPHHHFMSASKYGNPKDEPIVNKLDVVILGATEIDLNFNVNVTTDSSGKLMGGSGGHSDTAFGAKLTLITTNLTKSRTSIIKKQVKTRTTPGSSIDALVTERGIAIHPNRHDLLDLLKDSTLKIVPIESLYEKAIQMTGIPEESPYIGKVIGYIRYRDGSIIDVIRSIKEK